VGKGAQALFPPLVLSIRTKWWARCALPTLQILDRLASAADGRQNPAGKTAS
jgi:hypothetical protein